MEDTMKELYLCAALSSLCKEGIFMEQSLELSKAMDELARATGITLNIQLPPDTSEEDIAATVRQIRFLCSAYKEKYNKNYFLLNLMTGTSPDYDIQERASRLHIRAVKPRYLFLLESRKKMDNTVTEVLKQLFPYQEKIYLVPINEYQLALLYPAKDNSTVEDIHDLAHTMIDTLSMEALVHVQIAYSNLIPDLYALSGAYKQTALALRVGKLFYSEQSVFPFNKLGVGRLIHELPQKLCEDFLFEVLGDISSDQLDGDTLSAVDKFFQNNLNIAETARQLHMHRNTLIYRLEQVEKKTGLDLRQFEDAMTFKIAIMILNYLQSERNIIHE